jgi:hypothetical protein
MTRTVESYAYQVEVSKPTNLKPILFACICAYCALVNPATGVDNPAAGEKNATGARIRKMEPLPSAGFDDEASLDRFASSSEPAALVEKMKIAGEPVWVLTRTISLGGSTAEFSIYHARNGRVTPFMIMPLSVGEFKAFQEGADLSIRKYDYQRKRYDEIFRMVRIP